MVIETYKEAGVLKFTYYFASGLVGDQPTHLHNHTLHLMNKKNGFIIYPTVFNQVTRV